MMILNRAGDNGTENGPKRRSVSQFASRPRGALRPQGDENLGRLRGPSHGESCDDSAPHLITHVETTPAPQADVDVTPVIREDFQAKDLLPGEHLVDTGYIDAELLVQSKERYGLDLVGPT